MDRWERNSVLLAQVSVLKEHGSWCGETHVQKTAYFLEKLAGVPLGFDFVLYRYGPFSFDLRDELTELRAVGYLDLDPKRAPHGLSYVVTAAGSEVIARNAPVVARFEQRIGFVSERLATKNVSELERLATALFFTVEEGGDEHSRAGALHAAKPHVSAEDALESVRTVDRWIEESAALPA